MKKPTKVVYADENEQTDEENLQDDAVKPGAAKPGKKGTQGQG